jgi:hypothetical protein
MRPNSSYQLLPVGSDSGFELILDFTAWLPFGFSYHMTANTPHFSWSLCAPGNPVESTNVLANRAKSLRAALVTF